MMLLFIYVGLGLTFGIVAVEKKDEFEHTGSNIIPDSTSPIGKNGSFCEPNPCSESHVCMELVKTHVCVCPGNFVGKSCFFKCNTKRVDVAFLIDSSRSVTDTNWQKVLNYLEMMTKLLSIDTDLHRMGVVSFADEANIDFTLNRYPGDPNSITKHIYQLPFLGGMTNISGALKLTREEFFTMENGHRKGAEKHAIILTDGTSTIAKSKTVVEARKTIGGAITVYAVGVGIDINEKELATMVSQPASEHIFRTPDYASLGNVGDTLIQITCDIDLQFLRGHTGVEGPRGQPGRQGVTGNIGVTGVLGDRGPRGSRGETGPIGLAGNEGSIGDVGPEGDLGVEGPRGVFGPAGPEGPKGLKGDAGNFILGSTGVHGITGSVGAFGVTGATGRFPLGIRGRSGGLGVIGATGYTGATGGTGSRGVPGPVGGKGFPGGTGPYGDVGARGPDGVFRIVDSCEERSPQCQHTCKQTFADRQCECLPGYQLSSDGYSCEDTNECLRNNGGCEQECRNTVGSFVCSCKLGYTLSKNLHHCNDINECCAENSNPVCNQNEVCLNTLGSYGCISKEVAYFPKPVTQDQTGESVNETKSIYLSRDMFIGLLLWSGIVTILTLLTMVMIWFTDDNSLKRLRDAHLIEQRYNATKRSSAPNFIFPRFSTEDLTDYNPRERRPAQYIEPRLYAKDPHSETQLKPRQFTEPSFGNVDHRRGSATSVTIQSPGGHVTSINA